MKRHTSRPLSLLICALLIIVCLSAVCSCGSKEQSGVEQPTDDSDAPWQELLERRLAVASLLPGLPAASERPDASGRTWYQVFVYSFCDSDGDGIGDLAGVTERLDYISDLGFDGIWLSPIHPSQTYHKYDVDDYYSIDPEYGSMEDFDALLEACHALGMRVLLDLVLNHTSIDHPWFEEHPEYYHIQDEAGHGQWKKLPDGRYYECQFWERMPDLNLAHPGLRAELESVFAFWLGKGVDGFRLDAVKEYETGDNEANIDILTWVNDAIKAIKPDAYLVGENWTTANSLFTYYRSGVDSFFDFLTAGVDGSIAKTLLQGKPVAAYLESLAAAQDDILRYNPRGTAAPFFTNHDNPRAAGFLRRDEDMIKAAWGMALMQPGDAFVYYGEELGMSGSGKDENKRAPMFWASDAQAPGMTKGPPGMDTPSHSFEPAVGQMADSSSIYSYVRKAVQLRAKYPAIGRGDICVLDLGPADDGQGNAGAVARSWGGVSITIIYNVSPDATLIPDPGGVIADFLSASGEEPERKGSAIALPGYCIAILI
ncbi:MAG: alpha-amylase family glycosyl hydrolase [Oscillospiraceae bacterium]|nr:alpha-amylase family glycosyl hydrolase [Oscillospiraceae bacterium]